MTLPHTYPLVDLIETDEPVFWVYNNLADLYFDYMKNIETPYMVMGDWEKKPALDLELQIIKVENPQLFYIMNESFTWIIENYYGESFNGEYKGNWNYSEFAIDCFSTHYKIKEEDCKDRRKSIYKLITDIGIAYFTLNPLVPKRYQLDLVVEEYLKKIEPDWGIQYSSKDSIVMDKNRVYHFFEYHFKSYKGNCYDFINHCDKIINEVWEVESPQNLKRKKYFDEWKTEKVVEYGLDRSKLNLGQKNKIETTMSNLVSAEFNYRMIEDLERIMEKAMSGFKLPYGFLKYDMNEILTFFEKFYKSNFFVPSQILLFNREIKKRNYFEDKHSWLRDGSSNQYYTRDYILRLFGSHNEQIAVNKEQQEGDYDNSFVNYVNNVVSIIIKREFKLVVKPENLEDNFLDNLLSNKIKIKTETFFLELDKLGLEPIATPEPPQQQNENITQPLVKIRWNAQNNVLAYILVQLKQMSGKGGKPIIDNSYEDIAVFLKTNFDCYQDTEISTIATTLKSQSGGNNIPSPKKIIEIHKSDL
jgi:hypothetical protein